MGKKPTKRPTPLSHSRPPTVKPKTALSSRATRELIRTHHTLQKQHARALAGGDAKAASELQAKIASLGGLREYQRASLTGQRRDRGGDSSTKLMEWLEPHRGWMLARAQETGSRRPRMLEVGALAVDNACSRTGLFDVTRIDLHSQHADIAQQDFMQRPLPRLEAERFDIVSLSLVLNYVPDAHGRGLMLERTTRFLNQGTPAEDDAPPFPCLYLVLPAPCVTNSRYFNVEKLDHMMEIFGYRKEKEELSKKLIYLLYRWTRDSSSSATAFTKEEVNPGRSRNNFTVILNRD